MACSLVVTLTLFVVLVAQLHAQLVNVQRVKGSSPIKFQRCNTKIVQRMKQKLTRGTYYSKECPSVEKCRQLCLDDSTCISAFFYVLGYGVGRCHIKYGDDSPLKGSSPEYYIKKTCVAIAEHVGCFPSRVDSTGMTVANVPNIEECIAECDRGGFDLAQANQHFGIRNGGAYIYCICAQSNSTGRKPWIARPEIKAIIENSDQNQCSSWFDDQKSFNPMKTAAYAFFKIESKPLTIPSMECQIKNRIQISREPVVLLQYVLPITQARARTHPRPAYPPKMDEVRAILVSGWFDENMNLTNVGVVIGTKYLLTDTSRGWTYTVSIASNEDVRYKVYPSSRYQTTLEWDMNYNMKNLYYMHINHVKRYRYTDNSGIPTHLQSELKIEDEIVKYVYGNPYYRLSIDFDRISKQVSIKLPKDDFAILSPTAMTGECVN